MKRVLVTGSSRGIGRAIASQLADDGWTVAIHAGRDILSARSLAEELGKRAQGVYLCDLAYPAETKELIPRVLVDGPLDAVVNNAGIFRPLDFLNSSEDEFATNIEATYAVNLAAPTMIMRAACKHFESIGGGKVLNVASRVGFKSEARAAIYAASKAALINLTRSLAVELAPRNIQLFGIAPGWVDTAMSRDGMEDRLPSILESIPLGRMASPEDCASAASFLLSEQASYLSGVVIDINGASYFH